MVDEDERQEPQKDITESQIETALRPRLKHFKENAEALTLERVRRLIEKDLGIEKYSLDIHKKFIKRFLEQNLESAIENNAPKASEESLKKDTSLTKHEVEKPLEEHNTKNDVKDLGAEDEKKLDDSPILGVMDSKSKMANAQDTTVSEGSIKKAILERSPHFRANAETMTLVSVRRYLEEEIGLEKNTLDPFKKFIKDELDKVLNSLEVPSSKSSNKKTSTKSVQRVKNNKIEGPKKRKSPDRENDVPSKKQKAVKKSSEKNDSEESDRSESEDDQSRTSAAKSAKKKAVSVSATGYGETVENLKSIIRACGMSIPPSIYKKAKQVSEDERHDFLVNELEEILSREGLSNNPSEKEIKEVKKKKERARELEGIDMSNIVSSSRRRSTTSFMPPPKPKSPIKEDKSDAEDSESDEDDSSEDNDSEDDVDASLVDEELNEDPDEESD